MLWGRSPEPWLAGREHGTGKGGKGSFPPPVRAVVLRWLALGRGEAAGKGGQEAQDVLQKWRDANVDIQLGVVN